MKDYLDLTIRGKARRLRQMAITALQDFDLDVAKVSLISNEYNGIFRVDTQDKQKYIMRVCIPDSGHDIEHINSEMLWLNFLSQQADINTPQPLKTTSGKWVKTVEIDGVPQPRHCVIFTWVDGVDLEERKSPETWEQFGKLSAQLHKVAQSFTPPTDFHIMTYDSAFPFKEDCVLFEGDNRQHFTDEQYEVIKAAVERVEAEITQMYKDTSGLRVTHGDLHHWNVRIARGTLSPIDFEDLMWAYPIQDIATTLYYNRFDENYDDLFAAFKAGYETVLPFPEVYAGQVETHMLARRFNLLNYIFHAEEFDIAEFPNFIPLTMERIQWVQENVWNKASNLQS